MNQIIKVYECTRYDGMQIVLNYLGTKIHVEFKGGDFRHRAKFATGNMFVQDALENDVRFGKLYVKTQQFYDSPAAKEEANSKSKKKVTRVKTVNDAMRWLAENGFNPTGDGDLDDLMDKAGVEFPNLKR